MIVTLGDIMLDKNGYHDATRLIPWNDLSPKEKYLLITDYNEFLPGFGAAMFDINGYHRRLAMHPIERSRETARTLFERFEHFHLGLGAFMVYDYHRKYCKTPLDKIIQDEIQRLKKEFNSFAEFEFEII